jgi:hypothetical protein
MQVVIKPAKCLTVLTKVGLLKITIDSYRERLRHNHH